MIPSQRRDGVFTFNMQYHLSYISANPLLPIVVDHKWRKDSFRGKHSISEDVNIYVPEVAKNMISPESQEIPEIFTKFNSEKGKEWNDISIQDMLGRFSDLAEIEKKDK